VNGLPPLVFSQLICESIHVHTGCVNQMPDQLMPTIKVSKEAGSGVAARGDSSNVLSCAERIAVRTDLERALDHGIRDIFAPPRS
jgi:hypothetical protein